MLGVEKYSTESWEETQSIKSRGPIIEDQLKFKEEGENKVGENNRMVEATYIQNHSRDSNTGFILCF